MDCPFRGIVTAVTTGTVKTISGSFSGNAGIPGQIAVCPPRFEEDS
jgi:hypothetical protein